MIPAAGRQPMAAFAYQEPASKTFKLHTARNVISGAADGLDAVLQAIYLILNTERYKYLIYGWNYGVETLDLVGQPVDYAQSELKRRIQEALLWDSRVTAVDDFVFSADKKKVACSFTIRTIFGDAKAEKAVEL